MQLDATSRLDMLVSKTDPKTHPLHASSLPAYEILLAESKQQLSVDVPSLTQSLCKVDPARSATYLSELELFKRANQPKILAIQLQLADQLSVPPTPAPSHASAANKGIEMEKSKAPVFSGRTIDYPEFKRGWQKVAAVHWSDGNQVEQIKHKGDQETRKIITCCNTMEKVWS